MTILFKKTFIANFLLTYIAIISSILIYNYNYVNKDYSKIDLIRAKNLMIVAHPDDETFWGGAHLLKDDYLVVCITCGNNRTRVREFKMVIKKTDDQYIMLGYPDKVLGIKSQWKDEYSRIYNDISQIVSLKEWDLIVTHNPDGEYGHIHHKKTNNIVVEIYNNLNLDEPLYFFGKYYTKGRLSKLEVKPQEISEKLYSKKINELIGVYKSQDSVRRKFDHMFKYEEWTLYENVIAKD